MIRVWRSAAVALTAYLMLVAAGSVWWPMGRDQGVFAWVGDVILRGGLPFRDAWDVKGPATHYSYALVQSLFGRNLWGIRVFDLGLLAMGLALHGRLLRRHGGALAAGTGVLFFASIYLSLGYWHTAQPDGWAGLLLIAGASLLLGGHRPSLPVRALVGALVAASALYKSAFALFLLPFALSELVRSETRWRERLAGAAALGAGFAAVLALSGLWLSAQGAWREFLDIQLAFNPQVHQSIHSRALLRQLGELGHDLGRPEFLALYPLVGLGALRLWRDQRPLLLLLSSWGLLALALVVLQNKYYPYHWLPALGPTTALAGLGLAELRRLLGGVPQRGARGARVAEAAALAVLLLLFSAMAPPLNRAGFSAFALGSQSEERYYADFGPYGQGDFSFLADWRVAGYLRENSRPEDRVLVWGFEPVVYYLSGRAAPSRFGFNYPLVVSGGTEFWDRYRREFLEDLRAREPAYVAILDHDRNSLMAKTSRQLAREFHELDRFVRDGYQFAVQIEHFQIWRRKGYRPPGGAD